MSSMQHLSKDGEFRYIVQWFNEWSELQRDDFVPVLVEYLTATVQNATEVTGNNNAVYMNGLVHAVSQTDMQDRPMSLFQCRIKLFREWSPQWPLDFKQKLQKKIIELDTKVGEKIINELKTTTGTTTTTTNSVQSLTQANGFATAAENAAAESDCCEAEEDAVSNANAVIQAAQSIVAATEAAIQNDARLLAAELLNQETISTTVNSTPVAVDADVAVNDENAAATTTANNTTMEAELAEPVQLPTTPEHVAATTLATAIPI